MPNYESSISSKKFAGQPLKEYTVPDESGQEMAPIMRQRGPALHGSQPPIDPNIALAYQKRLESEDNAEVERQISEAREAKRLGRERLNDGAKRRLEMILNMTRTTREVSLLGNIFVLQSLSGVETREAYMIASEFDNTVQSPFEIRRQLLARSLVSIAGVEISQFVGTNSLEARLQLIDHLDESLLNRLFDDYSELVKESKDKFAIKSVEDAREIVEELKK